MNSTGSVARAKIVLPEKNKIPIQDKLAKLKNNPARIRIHPAAASEPPPYL